jgi:hypothetical protein
MYINLEIFGKTKLKPEDLFYLVVIKQTNKELLETIPLDVLGRLEELSLLTTIKGKKGDSEASKIRLSKKGSDLLINLSYEGAVDEQSEILGEWLIKLYKSKFMNNKLRNIIMSNKKLDHRAVKNAFLRNCFYTF